MDLDLTGKNALVTGASKGLGLAITRALRDEGVHVVAGARSTMTELAELTRDGRVDAVNVDPESVRSGGRPKMSGSG
jgi:NAD(P)-dependent dehydrogenase (short-subunit alcohol dehydrogenase family)